MVMVTTILCCFIRSLTRRCLSPKTDSILYLPTVYTGISWMREDLLDMTARAA